MPAREVSEIFFFQIKNVDGVRIIPAVCKNQDAFMNEILRCGFVVFDIAQEPSQIEAVIWTLNGTSEPSPLVNYQITSPEPLRNTDVPGGFREREAPSLRSQPGPPLLHPDIQRDDLGQDQAHGGGSYRGLLP